MKNILSIITALLLVSCSDFLEPKAQTEYVPRDISSINEMLLGEGYIQAHNLSVEIFSYNEIFSDDIACTADNCNNVQNASKYTSYKPYFAWHPEMFKMGSLNNTYPKVWKNTYSRILGCNAALDYLETVKGTQDEYNFVKGQALALRAFYYFNLVNLFGEPYYYNKEALGVPLKLNSNMEFDYLSRRSVEEVYSQIVQDLTVAEECFSKLPASMQFVKDGRVTLPMIQLITARVALFMEQYEKCAVYSKKVIDEWGLNLLNLNNFTPSQTQKYYEFSSIDNPEMIWLYGNAIDFARFFTTTIYLLPTSTAQTRLMFNASPSLINSYESGDLRPANYIIKESATTSNLAPYAKSPVNTSYTLLSTKFGKALRLSEAYMMLAESYYYLEKYSEAVDILESLRAKRFSTSSGSAYKVPSSRTVGNELLLFIKEERRREMCYEGLRWFDQRRWGMESFTRDWKEDGVISTFTMAKNDPAYTLPIPFDAIELNPNLVQNKLATPKY